MPSGLYGIATTKNDLEVVMHYVCDGFVSALFVVAKRNADIV